MLELKHISKSFHDHLILDDISIKLPDTGLIGIQGSSGCGKSTLLYIIGMLDGNFEGEILYDHQIIDNREDFIRQHVSYMMQNKDYVPSLTVKENIILSCQVSELSYSSQQLKKIVTQLGIQDFMNQYPSQLSGGQLKRVSIAKALLKDSSIILCDEPTGALHASQAQEVMKLLQTISQDALVIIVSHDPVLLKDYCDCVLTLKKGILNRKVIKNKATLCKEKKHRLYSLWFYPIRQFIYQRNKLLFLFLFQWIVIVAFFIIVTAMNGVFDAIEESEKGSVCVNMMTIENKSGEVFKELVSHQGTKEVTYDYHLERLNISSQQKEVNCLISFLPHQTSHILLKSGRLPKDDHEIVVSESLFHNLSGNRNLHWEYQSFQQDIHIVGVLEDSFFSQDELYCSPKVKEKIDMLKNEYALLVEAQSGKNRYLYNKFNQSYFVYSDVLERVENYQALLSLARMIAYVFIGISFVISLLLIMIVESTIYVERQHDVAYLLSLGLKKHQLLFLSIGEAICVGGVISIGGCLLSLLVYYYINQVYHISQYIHFELKLHKIIFCQWDLYGIIFLAYFFMCILGILVPMKKMITTDMIDVLREE